MKKYYMIRKVSWDELWHAVYQNNGTEAWDRVTQKEALRISKTLIYI